MQCRPRGRLYSRIYQRGNHVFVLIAGSASRVEENGWPSIRVRPNARKRGRLPNVERDDGADPCPNLKWWFSDAEQFGLRFRRVRRPVATACRARSCDAPRPICCATHVARTLVCRLPWGTKHPVQRCGVCTQRRGRATRRLRDSRHFEAAKSVCKNGSEFRSNGDIFVVTVDPDVIKRHLRTSSSSSHFRRALVLP